MLNTVTTVGKSCNPSLPRNFPFLHNCEIVHLGIYIVGNPLLECRYPKDSGRSLGGSGTCQYK